MLFVSLDPNQGSELDKLAALNKLLLRYHSPSCHHCQEMMPEWEKVKKDKRLGDANITIVDANVGITDGTKHPSARDVAKKGVPTIYLIEGSSMTEHEGGRTHEEIVTFALGNKSQSGGKRRKSARRRRTRHVKRKSGKNTRRRPTKKRRKTKAKRKTRK